jgi:hypothetical protein
MYVSVAKLRSDINEKIHSMQLDMGDAVSIVLDQKAAVQRLEHRMDALDDTIHFPEVWKLKQNG